MDSIQQKLEKFKAMGIPMPMEPVIVEAPVKNQAMAEKIAALKNGNRKAELNEIIQIVEKKPIINTVPEPKKRPAPQRGVNNAPENPNAYKVQLETNFGPTLAFDTDFADIDSIIESDTSSRSTNRVIPSAQARMISEETVSDNGSAFMNDLKNRLQKKVSAPAATQAHQPQEQSQTPSASFNIKEFDSRILEISKQVATIIAEEKIKSVLENYITKKSTINENVSKNTFQRFKGDIIKIEDQYYKLTPIKVKEKV